MSNSEVSLKAQARTLISVIFAEDWGQSLRSITPAMPLIRVLEP